MVSLSFTSESQNSAVFSGVSKIISVTMNSSACKIHNNSNLEFFSNQQWMTILTSSSTKLNTDTTVKYRNGNTDNNT